MIFFSLLLALGSNTVIARTLGRSISQNGPSQIALPNKSRRNPQSTPTFAASQTLYPTTTWYPTMTWGPSSTWYPTSTWNPTQTFHPAKNQPSNVDSRTPTQRPSQSNSPSRLALNSVAGMTRPSITYVPTLVQSPAKECKLLLALADANRNGCLDEADFACFIDLFANTSLGAAFSDLPTNIQSVFINLSIETPEGLCIPVQNALSTSAAAEQSHLREVCRMTAYAILKYYQAMASGNASMISSTNITMEMAHSPTNTKQPIGALSEVSEIDTQFPSYKPNRIDNIGPMPQPFITTVPTAISDPLTQCKQLMKLADTDHDQYLNATEYGRFVDLFTNSFLGPTFSSLPQSVKGAFITLGVEWTGGISINIQMSSTISAQQEAHLLAICDDTAMAIFQYLNRTSVIDTAAPSALFIPSSSLHQKHGLDTLQPRSSKESQVPIIIPAHGSQVLQDRAPQGFRSSAPTDNHMASSVPSSTPSILSKIRKESRQSGAHPKASSTAPSKSLARTISLSLVLDPPTSNFHDTAFGSSDATSWQPAISGTPEPTAHSISKLLPGIFSVETISSGSTSPTPTNAFHQPETSASFTKTVRDNYWDLPINLLLQMI